jgi:hypothetical protein
MKNLNWPSLTSDILSNSNFNQTTLAQKCKVSQQSVSNWTTDTRSPGVYARNILRTLAGRYRLNLENYKFTSNNGKQVDIDMLRLPEKILNLSLRVNQLPIKRQAQIIEMANFMMTREKQV